MSKMLQSFSPESDGWQFMWIILVVFLIGLGFSIERIIYIMVKSAKGRKDFLAKFGTHISAQRYDEALSYANATKLPIARVMAAIVAARNGGRENMSAACDAVFLTEAPRLTRYISIIQVMASISTLLGLRRYRYRYGYHAPRPSLRCASSGHRWPPQHELRTPYPGNGRKGPQDYQLPRLIEDREIILTEL